jgi:hypothetical protein
MEMLERRLEELRVGVRRAAAAGHRALARELRAELRNAELAWDDALARLEDEQPAAPGDAQSAAGNSTTARGPARTQPEGGGAPHVVQRAATAPGNGPLPPTRPAPPDEAATIRRAGPLLPLREQVHQALTLLAVPAAPKLVSAVHEAFFAGVIPSARLASLRRDEERSFRSAPFARPYYLCAALTAELLSPARGLLAVSTWPLDRRVIGPLSPRVNYLSAAIRVAESFLRIRSSGPAAQRLLWRLAANIPGAADGATSMDPETVARAAHAELEVHAESDQATRMAAAERARRQLDDAEQLFGSRLRVTRQAGAGGA